MIVIRGLKLLEIKFISLSTGHGFENLQLCILQAPFSNSTKCLQTIVCCRELSVISLYTACAFQTECVT